MLIISDEFLDLLEVNSCKNYTVFLDQKGWALSRIRKDYSGSDKAKKCLILPESDPQRHDAGDAEEQGEGHHRDPLHGPGAGQAQARDPAIQVQIKKRWAKVLQILLILVYFMRIRTQHLQNMGLNFGGQKMTPSEKRELLNHFFCPKINQKMSVN
jgi:hypothetical protein